MSKLLDIQGLKTYFKTDIGLVRALDGVDLSIERGKIHGVVGESGCGKSVTARSILRILDSRGMIVDGNIFYHINKADKNIIDLANIPKGSEELKQIRGNDISMIFQEPMTAFSPVYTIGNQIMEAILLHQEVDENEARKRAIDVLKKVGMPDAERRIDEYPHQLSGGMRQRAMIAMALSCNPKLLIADEPTTALDVTIQAQIIDLIVDLQHEYNMAVLMITHDMGVIAEMAEYVSVFYLGKVMEEGPVKEIFHNPLHPYTKALLKSIPKVERKKEKELYTLSGSVPDAYNIPKGCSFHPRCPEYIEGVCNSGVIEMISNTPDHKVRCVLYNEVKKSG